MASLRSRFLGSLLCITLAAPHVLAQGAGAPPAPSSAPAAPSTPPPSLADSLTGAAKDEYEAGKLLYGDGDYAGAVLKFQSAYDLSKDARLLWNMAAAEKSLRRYVRVQALLEQYLLEGGSLLTDADRADAQALLDTVRAFIAELTINVNEAGATVIVDGAPVGTTPLPGPVRVEMGSRQIRVHKPGFKEYSTTTNAVGGGKSTIDVKLEAEVKEGRLRVLAEAGAAIRVDGKLVGLGQWEGTLPSGPHSIEVTAKGKLKYHSDSMVEDKQLTTLQVTLQAEPSPLADKSSGAPWLWIGGGVLLAAGLGVGAYFLFRPEDEGPPPPIEGSLGTVELQRW